MKNNLSKYIVLSILSMLALSCTKNSIGGAVVDESKGPIVTVYGHTLYHSDISSLIDYTTSKEDSANIVDNYINVWVNDQLYFNKAKENVGSTAAIEKLVDEYRQSLVISEYQNRLLKEKIGESVSNSTLESYFNQNKDLFSLKENLVKGLFLIVSKNSKELNDFRKWYASKDPSVINNIEQNLLKNAVGYENFFNTWVSLDKVLDNLPESITDQEKFLKTNKTYEVSDSTFVYFLNIKEYKLKGADAPFDYIKDDVKASYLESKRTDFLDDMKKNIRKEAEDKGQLIYHNLKK